MNIQQATSVATRQITVDAEIWATACEQHKHFNDCHFNTTKTCHLLDTLGSTCLTQLNPQNG